LYQSTNAPSFVAIQRVCSLSGRDSRVVPMLTNERPTVSHSFVTKTNFSCVNSKHHNVQSPGILTGRKLPSSFNPIASRRLRPVLW